MDNKGEKIRILLADSDEEFCAQMAALCEASEDMELVGIAENGDKALAAVGELRPELLITELSLPGMDGVMLLETLHREGKMPAVFVISAFRARRSVRSVPIWARTYSCASRSRLTRSASASGCGEQGRSTWRGRKARSRLRCA